MDTLDKDRLDFLIRSLTQAKKFGFSSLSSPVEILLEAGTDLLLVLSNNFERGRKSLPLNAEIGFSQDFQDALGNPKQFRIQRKNPVWLDPQIAQYLRKMASFLVAVKNRQSLPKALKASGLAVERLNTNSKKLNLSATVNLKQKRADFRLKQSKIRSYYRRQDNRNKRDDSIDL